MTGVRRHVEGALLLVTGAVTSGLPLRLVANALRHTLASDRPARVVRSVHVVPFQLV